MTEKQLQQGRELEGEIMGLRRIVCTLEKHGVEMQSGSERGLVSKNLKLKNKINKMVLDHYKEKKEECEKAFKAL